MSLSVTSVLKNIQDNFLLYEEDEEESAPVRAKKRRLDHLSWEEKLQRKKLKNRVAAQTSRDRKKARMEQMEDALRELSTQHDNVVAESENLRRLNEKLAAENEELRNKLKEPCDDCSRNRGVECVDRIIGSTASSCLLQRGPVRYSARAPKAQTLEALWKIVIAYLLYQTSSTSSIGTSTLAPSSSSHRVCSKISPQTWRQLLKKQIVKHSESNQNSPNVHKSTNAKLAQSVNRKETQPKMKHKKPEDCGQNDIGKVVGSPPENLESSRSVGLNGKRESDISEFLLLHHDYSKAPLPTRTRSPKKRPERKLKQIKPKTEEITSEIKVEPMDITDTVYGTYDEETNCITIYVDDDSVQVKEEVVNTTNSQCNVSNDHNYLKVPESDFSCRSSSSDCGYESLGSPNSLSDLDIWDQSVSELFPSLL